MRRPIHQFGHTVVPPCLSCRAEGAAVERARIVATIVEHCDWASDNGRFRADERDLIVGACNAVLTRIEKEKP